MPDFLRCPFCQATVQPLVGPDGRHLCPECRNQGRSVSRPSPAAAVPAQPEASSAPARGKPSGLAVAALCLGIASLVVFPLAILLGPAAIVVGTKALKAGKGDPADGRPLAITGIVLGAIGIVVGITVVLAAVVFVLVSNLAASSDPASFTFDATGVGGNITVTDVRGSIDWSHLVVDTDADCLVPTGRVDVGDQVVCRTDGVVTIRHNGEVLFEETL